MTPLMIEATQALTIANESFEQRLRLVGREDWVRPTPCTEWDVRALVNHVVGGAVRYVMLLQAAPPDEVEATRARDHLADDPVVAFVSTAAQLAAVFQEEGALARTVRHRVGERTGAQLLSMRVLDVAVHGWDLSVAVGGDETIACEVVDFLLDLSPDLDRGRQLGAFARPLGEPPRDASPQARLLHLVGRNPRHAPWDGARSRPHPPTRRPRTPDGPADPA